VLEERKCMTKQVAHFVRTGKKVHLPQDEKCFRPGLLTRIKPAAHFGMFAEVTSSVRKCRLPREFSREAISLLLGCHTHTISPTILDLVTQIFGDNFVYVLIFAYASIGSTD
jgi:hypothetical protein